MGSKCDDRQREHRRALQRPDGNGRQGNRLHGTSRVAPARWSWWAGVSDGVREASYGMTEGRKRCTPGSLYAVWVNDLRGRRSDEDDRLGDGRAETTERGIVVRYRCHRRNERALACVDAGGSGWAMLRVARCTAALSARCRPRAEFSNAHTTVKGFLIL